MVPKWRPEASRSLKRWVYRDAKVKNTWFQKKSIFGKEVGSKPERPTNPKAKLCLEFLTQNGVVFDHFGRLWEASGVLWGLILEMKIEKMASGAQNDPKLAHGEFCANVRHPF